MQAQIIALAGRVEKGIVMEKAIRKYFPIFALPTLLAFTIGFIVPFIYGIFLSFCKFTTVTDWTWVGLQNYTKIFVVNGTLDTSFLHSMWYTALFTVVSVCIINVVSFIIAMALTKGIRGTNIFRTVFFLPTLIGGIVLSYVWLMIFNAILQNFSKTIVSSQWSAFWGLIIVVCWQQIGYMMIIYVAGIQNIPGELLEAAKIDGANGWKTFWKITVPLLMPTIVMTVIMSINGTLQLFDESMNLTMGGPAFSTITMSHYIYNNAFGLGVGKFGYASAMSFFIFVLVAILSAISMKVGDNRD